MSTAIHSFCAHKNALEVQLAAADQSITSFRRRTVLYASLGILAILLISGSAFLFGISKLPFVSTSAPDDPSGMMTFALRIFNVLRLSVVLAGTLAVFGMGYLIFRVVANRRASAAESLEMQRDEIQGKIDEANQAKEAKSVADELKNNIT